MRSYSSHSKDISALLREGIYLVSRHSRDIPGKVSVQIEDARRVENRVREVFGVELESLEVLEVGPGQFLMQMAYFAAKNRVVGIDRDFIAQEFSLSSYWAMCRQNGARRMLKTLVRKALNVDRRYRSELERHLCVERLPRLSVLPMDVSNMSFADNSFDFVYSRSVLHHMPNPAAAVREISRVLRPGGIAYVSVHPYTSQTGCLDPRVMSGRWDEALSWPHLRATLKHTIVEPNVYLNKLRPGEWQALFSSNLGEVEYIVTPGQADAPRIARALHQQGELLDYSIEELSMGELVALWKNK